MIRHIIIASVLLGTSFLAWVSTTACREKSGHAAYDEGMAFSW